jgi:hypothetical protein
LSFGVDRTIIELSSLFDSPAVGTEKNFGFVFSSNAVIFEQGSQPTHWHFYSTTINYPSGGTGSGGGSNGSSAYVVGGDYDPNSRNQDGEQDQDGSKVPPPDTVFRGFVGGPQLLSMTHAQLKELIGVEKYHAIFGGELLLYKYENGVHHFVTKGGQTFMLDDPRLRPTDVQASLSNKQARGMQGMSDMVEGAAGLVPGFDAADKTIIDGDIGGAAKSAGIDAGLSFVGGGILKLAGKGLRGLGNLFRKGDEIAEKGIEAAENATKLTPPVTNDPLTARMRIENHARQRKNVEVPRVFDDRRPDLRPFTAEHRAQVNKFGDRCRALGWVENPMRTGEWGKMVNGKFKALARIDTPKLEMGGVQGQTHLWIYGVGNHIEDLTTKLPGE